MLSSRHVVILKETGRERYLPIWIGPWEASSIAMRLQGLTPERPLTHDLFASTLEARRRATVARVVISDLADETFHARLFVERDGQIGEIDARPSDALALAVRVGAPIFAVPSVLDQAGLGRRRRARRRRGGRAARVDRRADRRPAARRVPRLRELARRRPGAGGPRELGSLDWRVAQAGGSPWIGQPRRSARRGSPTCAAAAARSRAPRAGSPGAWRRSASPPCAGSAGTPTSTTVRPAGAQLDQQLGREEGALPTRPARPRGPRAGTACRRSRRR